MRVSAWLLVRYVLNENRFHHFFLFFCPVIWSALVNFVTLCKEKQSTPRTHPRPIPIPSLREEGSPTISPEGEGKTPEKRSNLKTQPSKFNLQNSNFKIQPSKFNLPKAPHLSTLISHLYISIINYQLSTIWPLPDPHSPHRTSPHRGG